MANPAGHVLYAGHVEQSKSFQHSQNWLNVEYLCCLHLALGGMWPLAFANTGCWESICYILEIKKPLLPTWLQLQLRAALSKRHLHYFLQSKQSHWAVPHFNIDKEVWPPQAEASYLTETLTGHKWWQLLFVSQQEDVRELHHRLMSQTTKRTDFVKGDILRESQFQVF